MPSVRPGESREDFISRCIPIVMEEGTANSPDQAAAICYSKWDEHVSKSLSEEVMKMHVYADSSFWGDLCPQEGESYQDFVNRVKPALIALNPDVPEEEIQAQIESAWAHHVLQNASEATITIKREFVMSPVYQEGWWTDWEIAEVHSAITATMTYSSVGKSKAGLVGSADTFRIAKTAEDKQLVFGWANIAKDANGNYPLDWDGDVTRPEDLEVAAYTFVLKYRATGEKHEGDVKGHLVESIMFTKEKQRALGIPDGILPEGWWVGFYIPDKEVFAKIKSGEYEMFSVQGKARRVPTGM